MSKSKVIIFSTLSFILVLTGIFLLNKYYFQRLTEVPAQVFTPEETSEVDLQSAPAITTFASEQRVVWAMDFLPDGRMIFTERDGAINTIGTEGAVNELYTVDVHRSGESGLLGIAVDQDFDFEEQPFIYLYYTYQNQSGNTLNRVSRYTFTDDSLSNELIIIDRIPGASTHDGGRIAFGPDGFLYVTTGDAQAPSAAQDTNSLAGKILRVTKEGEPAPDNPFSSLIYSYGHRNPQGITWDEVGTLWSTEHGPSARDELNRLQPGGNYGWPVITGSETRGDMITPVNQSGSSTWAPGGATYFNGSIYFTGLRGSALYEYTIASGELTTHLKDKFGRIRDVVLGPDNFLYIATSNRDGRGLPVAEDDRILRINPTKIREI